MIIDMRAIGEKLRQFEFDCPHEIDLWNDYELRRIAGDDDIEEIENDMVRWCKENIKSRSMYQGDLKFLFQLEEDAAAFKLAWS